MRKYILVIALAVAVLAGSVLVLHQVKAQTQSSVPTLVVSPAVSPLSKTANLIILGSGYKPNADVNILFYDGFGSIGALEEPVKTDDRGNFATSWMLGDYSRGGILPDGVTTIMSADENFTILASAPAAFADVGKDYAKWSGYAKAVFPKPAPKAKETPKPTAEAKPTTGAEAKPTGSPAPEPKTK